MRYLDVPLPSDLIFKCTELELLSYYGDLVDYMTSKTH